MKTITPQTFITQAQATERAVLGSILKNPDNVPVFSSAVYSEFFTLEANASIWEAMVELELESTPIDIMTVYQALQSKKTNVKPDYLVELTENAAITQNVNFYVNKLIENHVNIKAHSLLRASLALGPIVDIARIIAELQSIEELKTSQGDDAMDWGEVSRKIIGKLESGEELREGYLPQDSFARLNEIAPLHKGELCIVGAIESGGKTAFAVNLCLGLAREGARGIYFFYESTPENLQFRIASITTKIPMERILRKDLSPQELSTIKDRLSDFGDELLYKDKSQKGAIHDLIGYVKARIKKNPCDYIVIDHMHQMPISGKIREGFIDISRRLLALAKQENICVIALAQFRKPSEKELDKRPHRGMIRESSTIAQDAHHIWFLHDPVYLFNKRKEQSGDDKLGKFNNYKTRGGQDDMPAMSIPTHAEIIIDKNREGRTDILPAEFRRECMLWRET